MVHSRRRQGLLRRPRPQGDAGLAEPRLLPRSLRRLHRGDAGDPAPAGAGDRARPRRRHRGGLSARGDVRPCGRLDRGALRRKRRQLRAVLLDAGRRPVAEPACASRRWRCCSPATSSTPRRRASAAWSTTSSRPNGSTPKSKPLVAKIVGKPRVAIAIGKEQFYRQIDVGIVEAYAIAGEAMACNMMDEARSTACRRSSTSASRGNALFQGHVSIQRCPIRRSREGEDYPRSGIEGDLPCGSW